ncbi:L,D-transpeptidase family protein [Sneathiella glossodoripedis]|uniref:L,D-transpeptidase family protein n=1 Tax=Sneathiella glossodoripedis TaxID=418853 RepID=UPI00046F3DD3|nr:L,D-transpeptidase family protein [Sneathiella glossodoripedis]
MYIQVKATDGHLGQLEMAGKLFPCALGKAGVTADKKEGDHASPLGCFPLREVYYRPDRVKKPETFLPCYQIQQQDGWCDDPAHPSYNQKIQRPFTARHETLWREDHLYDVIVVLGYNDDPPVPGKGSCIFMHVAKDEYEGTEGCIALSIQDLLIVLTSLDKDTLIEINAGD